MSFGRYVLKHCFCYSAAQKYYKSATHTKKMVKKCCKMLHIHILLLNFAPDKLKDLRGKCACLKARNDMKTRLFELGIHINYMYLFNFIIVSQKNRYYE